MGWVTNKNVGQMSPNEALILTNWFPNANTVDMIRGFEQYANTASASPVDTLMTFNGPASTKLLTATNGSIFNVTGGTSTSLASGYANNRWQWVNFENAGGAYVVAVNGADAPINYNGTAIATSPAITGVTADNLINIDVFKNRIFLVEKDSLNFWYLGLGAIGGAATKFTLGEWCKKGGYLMATGTWSRDGGDGMDDLFVALTSKGECLIYQGSDPSSSTDWSLIGVFDVGEPIGRRCLFKFANDLCILTVNGVVPLSKVLTLGASAASAIAITSQIEPSFDGAQRAFRANFGWQGTVYPKGNMIVINIPVSANTASEQFVANSQTGAWCKFTGHNANSWVVYDEELYFGTMDGKVMKADTGATFNGSAIPTDLETSFNYFGNTGQIKNFQMVRPVMFTSGNISYNYTVNVDFIENTTNFRSSITSVGTPWGSAWGSAWSNEQQLVQKWLSGGKQGRCAAFRMRTNLTGFSINLSAIDWIMNTGGGI